MTVPDLDDGTTADIPRCTDELAVVDELLELDGRDVLELGCGRAEKTLALAASGRDRRFVALEVDEIQHRENLAGDQPSNVRFALGGAQAIPAPDRSFDVVMLFKSLHHVPVDEMDAAMAEIARVLRPGGLAYISEPLFRGAFNDVLRIFHDESAVRRAAFDAIRRAVAAGTLTHLSRTLFRAPLHFTGFAEFDRRVIGVTHTRHVLDDATRARVRSEFKKHEATDGSADFEQPIRVDLLQRPNAAY